MTAWIARALDEMEAWLASDAALRAALSYQNHYLARYLRLKAEGVDERSLAPPRGNARGRFYEGMVVAGLSRAVRSDASAGVEFACAGGSANLGGGALSRDEKGDVVLASPSYRGGPSVLRAEFDALAWHPVEGPVLIELTASSGNLPDLVSDLWRKQLVAMRAFALAAPPRVVLVSPHALSSVQARVARLVVRPLPFPEALWNIAVETAGRRELAGALAERAGPVLRGARDPDYPTLVEELAGAFVKAVEGADVLGFCAARRDEIAMARRIYVGALGCASQEEVATLLSELSGGREADTLQRAARGSATVHLTLRLDAYHQPIRPIVHVLTRASGPPGELRVHPGRRIERITDFHKAAAFRSEVAPHGGRVLSAVFISAAVAACTGSRVFEPSIRRDTTL